MFDNAARTFNADCKLTLFNNVAYKMGTAAAMSGDDLTSFTAKLVAIAKTCNYCVSCMHMHFIVTIHFSVGQVSRRVNYTRATKYTF